MNIMVVLNFNDSETVCEFFKTADQLTCIDRFVIVDNCSTDNSLAKMKASIRSERVDFVSSDKNGGYGYGNNVGLRYAKKKYPEVKNLIISNPDIDIENSDLEKILMAVESGYGMATGLIYLVPSKGGEPILASNFAWKLPNYGDMICNCFLILYKIRRNILNNSNYINYNDVKKQSIINAEAVPGCFFVVEADLFERIGYFDEDTFLFGEETILGYKIKDCGGNVCVVSEARVFHKASTSVKKDRNAMKNKINYRLDSEIVYLRKYLKCNTLSVNLYRIAFRLGRIEQGLIMFIVKKFKK